MGKRRHVRDGYLLTPRETEILALTSEGLQAKNIADKLGISERTVTGHIAEIRFRLKAATIGHAVAEAFHLGILTVRDVE